MKKTNWTTQSYKTTQVNWARSQSQIYKMLGELGIYEIRFTNVKSRFVLEFLVQIRDEEKPRAVRIVVPIKYQGDNDKEREKELNIVHRILLNHLKAKFIAIKTGLTEFEEEFMAHLIITDNQGNSRTIGETLLPQYKKAIDEGRGGDFKLLGGG